MRHAILTLFLAPAVILAFSMQVSHALDLPDEAFLLIAQAGADPCSICGEQKLKQAFAVMTAKLRPGMVVDAGSGCGLVKRDAGGSYELSLTCYPSAGLKQSVGGDQKLPDLVFSFYTLEKRLVGIADSDCTGAEMADVFRAAPPGTVFEGRVRLVPYAYGDGPSFNYFPQTDRVQVHCVLLELRPLKK